MPGYSHKHIDNLYFLGYFGGVLSLSVCPILMLSFISYLLCVISGLSNIQLNRWQNISEAERKVSLFSKEKIPASVPSLLLHILSQPVFFLFFKATDKIVCIYCVPSVSLIYKNNIYSVSCTKHSHINIHALVSHSVIYWVATSKICSWWTTSIRITWDACLTQALWIRSFKN